MQDNPYARIEARLNALEDQVAQQALQIAALAAVSAQNAASVAGALTMMADHVPGELPMAQQGTKKPKPN